MPKKHEVTPEELKILIEAAACWDEVLWSGGYVPNDTEELKFYNDLASLLERLGERTGAVDGARYQLDADYDAMTEAEFAASHGRQRENLGVPDDFVRDD